MVLWVLASQTWESDKGSLDLKSCLSNLQRRSFSLRSCQNYTVDKEPGLGYEPHTLWSPNPGFFFRLLRNLYLLTFLFLRNQCLAMLYLSLHTCKPGQWVLKSTWTGGRLWERGVHGKERQKDIYDLFSDHGLHCLYVMPGIVAAFLRPWGKNKPCLMMAFQKGEKNMNICH